jgi:hypothetical protein
MKRREFISSLIAAGVLSRTVWAANAELAVIVHPSNSVKQLSDTELQPIFLTTRRHWSGATPIVAFNLPSKTDPRVHFDRVVLHMDPEEVARFWIDRRIRGGENPPRQAPDPALMVRLIARLENGIGYVPREVLDSSVKVVAWIRGDHVTAP